MTTKILFTGGYGFVGRRVIPLLYNEGIEVSILDVKNGCDLSKEIPVLNRHDVVVHAAGKAHSVPKTEEEKKAFFDVNVNGSKNLCEGILRGGWLPKLFIFISTVAVYGVESGVMIDEKHELRGKTAYASSKIEAEEFLSVWCAKYGVRLVILRPALLIGDDAPGNWGAMVSGIKSGRYFSIAGGKAKKSVFRVEQLADVIIRMINNEDAMGVFNVCDNTNPSFHELEGEICERLNKKRPMNIPYWVAKSFALVGDCMFGKAPIDSVRLKKITSELTFSCDKLNKID